MTCVLLETAFSVFFSLCSTTFLEITLFVFCLLAIQRDFSIHTLLPCMCMYESVPLCVSVCVCLSVSVSSVPVPLSVLQVLLPFYPKKIFGYIISFRIQVEAFILHISQSFTSIFKKK